jgi:serine/threonine protein kinase
MKPPETDRIQDTGDSLAGFLESPIFTLTPMSDNSPGTIIDDRYVIEQELGHTTMSQVYLAHDRRLNDQWVVIKVLSEALFEDEEAKRRFDNELKTLTQLDHPHVIQVKDSGELVEGRPYFVMPYVEGETLRSQIPPNTGMDLETAASILKQIGAALDYVHDNDVFHQDLKPENVMLKRGSDSVVLIDFGIATLRNAPAADGTLVGTPAYMSPEQLAKQKITAASDIYSMGVVAYEMLTGRRPFNPESPWQMRNSQRAGVPVRPSHLRSQLPLKVDRIIIRALSFDPKARYKTAGEFADKLAQALLEKPGQVFTLPLLWPKLAALILILALLTFGIMKRCDKTPESRRSFKYWLTVQKMHDGKEYQAPFQSNGEDSFESGDKFQLNVSSPTAAYLYVFHQGPSDTTGTGLSMLYPNAATNGGSANVGANQPLQFDWTTFRGPAGAENFWLVWSVSPNQELEAARVEALKRPQGGLTGESLVAVTEFLRTRQAEFKSTVFHYKDSQTAVARGKTDTLIALAQFKHR